MFVIIATDSRHTKSTGCNLNRKHNHHPSLLFICSTTTHALIEQPSRCSEASDRQHMSYKYNIHIIRFYKKKMNVLLPFLVGIILVQLLSTHGFVHTSSSPSICRFFDSPIRTTSPASSSSSSAAPTPRRSISSPSSSRLFVDLWERMEIDEDEEVEWYLLNCVAGLEIDLLRQCRAKMVEMPAEDVVKFVVPTMVKTRSHGANRMVSETKVKYLGYVFAKLRLCRATYTPIQKMDLCRSWMGTINIKGHKKLPPAPLPLSEEEIENFDLDNVIWEKDEQDETKAAKEKSGIIMDTVENDRQENEREREKEEAIEEVCRTVYKSLKVEDMVKVTAKNKFFDEDGIIRRLKEGMVFVRFFTYGTMFEEWLDPSDVRKLTETEIVDGLGGPAAPITQRDLDGPQDNERYNDDPRNTVGAFGGGPATRDRRQDRTERSFEKDRFDPKKERENWNQYKENEKRNEGGAYNDGNGVEFRAGSKTDFRAESDVDSQWGRNNQPQERQRGDRRTEQAGPSRGRQEDDWSSFVNTPTSKNKQTNSQTSKEETDDFFSSLMSDLSKDMDGNQGQRGGQGEGRRDQKPAESASQDSDDDFFASLMSDIEDEPSERTKSPPSTKKGNNADDDDDFFASLEREIKGSPSSNKSEPTAGSSSGSTNSASSVDEDDFFASLEMELASDLGDVKKVASADSKKEVKTSFATDNSAATAAVEEDDFFSNLEAELQSDLDGGENENDEQIATPQTIKDDDAQVPVEKSSTTRDEKENNVPSITSAFDAATLKKQTVPQLKEILRDRGLKLSGKKAELIERINSSA